MSKLGIHRKADVTNHHIQGFATAAIDAGEPGYFSMPLISHIHGNLFVGGCIDGVKLPGEFRHVVSLYTGQRYELGRNTDRIEIEMYDVEEMPDFGELYEIAAKVNDYCAEGQTLVHCQAGLNRSNLVAGLALILAGMVPADAIALLRTRRSPVVLCNKTFEQWLLAVDITSFA